MPKDIYDAWDYTEKGQDLENTWNAEFDKYKNKYPKKPMSFKEELLQICLRTGWKNLKHI